MPAQNNDNPLSVVWCTCADHRHHRHRLHLLASVSHHVCLAYVFVQMGNSIMCVLGTFTFYICKLYVCVCVCL